MIGYVIFISIMLGIWVCSGIYLVMSGMKEQDATEDYRKRVDELEKRIADLESGIKEDMKEQ